MKTGFKDKTEIKKQKPRDPTEKERDFVWSFAQPQYDERTSCFMNAGTHYGIGHRQPVGEKHCKSHFGDGKEIPIGRPNTMEVDEAG